MACSKYTLTNTGSTLVNFNYRRCDDSLWEYQVELNPSQSKNIWLIDNTYSIASSFKNSVSLVNQGVFPLVSATQTPTPTNTPTPTQTPTQTQTPTNTGTPTQTPTQTSTQTGTPTNTPTQTPTPTEPVRYIQTSICHDESDGEDACDCPQTATVWTNAPTLSGSTLMFSDMNGANTGNPQGWYVENGVVYEVSTDCGIGCTTGSTISVFGPCAATPTPTPTNTETPTQTPTPTNTETPTQTPTPTNTETPTSTPTQTPTPTQARNAFVVYSGVTYDDACGQYNSTVTIYGEDIIFDNNTVFYNELTGPVTIDMSGYYNYSQIVVQLDSNGNETGGFSACVTLTPTPTNTQTPTMTPTQTTTPTATFGYYTYTLGSGATSNDSCIAFSGSPNTVYGSVAGGIGPNVGETLYQTAGNPPTDTVGDGYYSNGTAWFLVSGGSGVITSSDPNGCL